MTWIKCSERLPDEGVHVLMLCRDDMMHIGYRNEFTCAWVYAPGLWEMESEPDYWMDLPELPGKDGV